MSIEIINNGKGGQKILPGIADGGRWWMGGGYPVKCGRLHKSLNSNLKNGQNSPKLTYKCSVGLIFIGRGGKIKGQDVDMWV